MTDRTRFIKYQLDLFYRDVDNCIEDLVHSRDYAKHAGFLNQYIQNFPTLGDPVYQHIFKSTDLHSHYADYTLQVPLNGGDPEVEKKRRKYPQEKEKPFYIHYYHKYILQKVKPMKEAGINSELKRFLDHWDEKLEKQGYLFQYDARESATVRNIAFHLAFALKMDVKTLKNILLKCLLQQVFNPKNHLECIFWYCLKHDISYSSMRSDFLDYYRSDAFDEAFRNSLEKGIVDTPTQMLVADIQEMMDKDREEFFRYLWRLKYTEKLIDQGVKTESGRVLDARALKWKTLSTVYWENICHFVDVEDPSTVEFPITEEEYTVRFVEIWKKLRRSCHESNTDPLMDRQTLKILFAGIDYTKRGIENCKWGKVDMSRTEIIVTQFIARCTRGPARNMSRGALQKDFQDQVNEDLINSGLRKLYLGSPFELFLILCFLHEDPFCYFMASWEEAVREI